MIANLKFPGKEEEKLKQSDLPVLCLLSCFDSILLSQLIFKAVYKKFNLKSLIVGMKLQALAL